MLLPTPTPEAFNTDSFIRGFELAFSTIPIWVWIPLIVLGVLRLAMILRKRSERQKQDLTRERNHEDTER
jgi:hypothetical protein